MATRFAAITTSSPSLVGVVPGGEKGARGLGSKSQRGVAALEFAIVLPVLITLLFGLWEFGRIFDAWLIVTNAAREGARYASISTNDTDVKIRVADYINGGYGPRLGLAGDVVIDLNNPDYFQIDRPATSGPVTVTIRAAIEVYAPVVPVLTNPFTVTAWSTMRQ